jgi:type IV pilus assembly protein PilY1
VPEENTMRSCIRFPRAILTAAAVSVSLGLLIAAPAASVIDDTVLFSTNVTPNVLIVMDNSGSMNTIVWHPGYDPNVASTCANWTDTSTYYYSNETTITRCGRTRTIYIDNKIGASTRYSGHYLNWLFSPAADAAVAEIGSDNNGFPSNCVGGSAFPAYKRARISAAKQVLKDVACEANLIIDIRFGLATFRLYSDGDPNGGYVRVPVEEYTSTVAANFVSAVESIDAKTWTPLSESLFQFYTYFMSRTETDRPFGKDGVTRFPEYVYQTSTNQEGGLYSGSGAPQVPDSPVQYSCQKNFILIITDGEPTKDDFDIVDPTNTAQGFDAFVDKLIGDYNPDGEVEEPGDASESSFYLDDIAMFMQNNDFRLDMDDDQVIDTYTVGFTTGTVANALLSKTAQVGNGLFFHSNNAEELTEAIIAAMTDIIQKSQSFTAATVPAARTSIGENLYVSLFIPSDKTPYWEGHLENFQITALGEILDRNGDCALASPVAGECFSGPFLPEAEPFWDAGEEVPSPAMRNLFTSLLSVPGDKVPFDDTLQAADLGVIFPPLNPYDGSTALNAEGLTDEIVQNVRGCEFGTGVLSGDVATPVACVERPWLLGDIFHSNPLLVGPPALFLAEPSYKQFETNYATRKRAIYAGANDGFLRSFLAGVWDAGATPPAYDHGTGEELFGFMPWPGRQNVKDFPNDGANRDVYFVDGSPTVTDAWFYSIPTTAAKAADGSEWHTVIVGGMRQGGETYYALDITNPDAASYPDYLWEFPREDAPASISDYVGQTWSEPILTRIRVKVGLDDNEGAGYERWVAIFAGGYDPSGDPNNFAAYDAAATEGRAIFVVDIKTGEVLGMKKFDDTDPTDPESQMLYAIPSTPAVYDLDFDGFADVIYVGDLGGNMWKWVIHEIGEDRVNDGSGSHSQPRWPFKKFFEAPIYQQNPANPIYYKSFFFPPAATFKGRTLWLAFGTGERANLKFMGSDTTADDNNRFYAMTDLDPLEKAPVEPHVPLGEPDLTDVSNDESCVSFAAGERGYYFVGADGEKFVTNADVFFYYVFVGSYIPTENVDPCETGGIATLYVFKIHCGEGFFEDGSDPDRDLDVGSGMPTDPRITIGTDGEQSNRVIINKQAGEILNIEAPPGFGSGVGMFYWREMD